MSSWFWTKFCWGMLLIPIFVIALSVIEGESESVNLPTVAFVVFWMAGVLLIMRKLGVPPFTNGDDS